eukprot:m.1638828 g.1638828  ORF g.1638828 m.1638828 type:complete len:53 (+) comp31275_c0_seq1:190-348(+)
MLGLGFTETYAGSYRHTATTTHVYTLRYTYTPLPPDTSVTHTLHSALLDTYG